METNGTLYCDECNLAIMQQKHVRLPRPQIAGKVDQQEFAHFHKREGYSKDCWHKVKERAEARAKAKPPTAADMSEYEKWCAQKDARRAMVQ